MQEYSTAVRAYYVAVRPFPKLTPQEEAALRRRLRDGDEAARQRLAEGCLRLVLHLARTHPGRGKYLEDLIGVGNVALVRAADGFAPDCRFPFPLFAWAQVRRAMFLFYAHERPVVRVPRHEVPMQRLLAAGRHALRQELGREPTRAELAERTGLREARIEWEATRPSQAVSVAHPAVVTMRSPDPSPVEALIEAEGEAKQRKRLEAAGAALARLPRRQRFLVASAYGLLGGAGGCDAAARTLGRSHGTAYRMKAAGVEAIRAETGAHFSVKECSRTT